MATEDIQEAIRTVLPKFTAKRQFVLQSRWINKERTIDYKQQMLWFDHFRFSAFFRATENAMTPNKSAINNLHIIKLLPPVCDSKVTRLMASGEQGRHHLSSHHINVRLNPRHNHFALPHASLSSHPLPSSPGHLYFLCRLSC